MASEGMCVTLFFYKTDETWHGWPSWVENVWMFNEYTVKTDLSYDKMYELVTLTSSLLLWYDV